MKAKSQLFSLKKFTYFKTFSTYTYYVYYFRGKGYQKMNFSKYHIAAKDYIFTEDSELLFNTDKADIIRLCDRQKGIGADGIFTTHKNNVKTSFLRGFNQNGQHMRDFSSASICAFFELFSTTTTDSYTFLSENGTKNTVKMSKQSNPTQFIFSFENIPTEGIFNQINRKTEIGNRILTITPVILQSIYTVHFSDCRDKLNLEYLGCNISKNSLFRKSANLILAQPIATNSFDINFYENKTGCHRPVLSAYAATALSACKNGICKFGDEISVFCDNNKVKVICHDTKNVTVECSCEKVFSGNI